MNFGGTLCSLMSRLQKWAYKYQQIKVVLQVFLRSYAKNAVKVSTASGNLLSENLRRLTDLWAPNICLNWPVESASLQMERVVTAELRE